MPLRSCPTTTPNCPDQLHARPVLVAGSQIDQYLDAFRELLLQTSVLVGNHSTLWRWLLPDWSSDAIPPRATLPPPPPKWACPTRWSPGIPLPDQQIENTWPAPKPCCATPGSSCSTPLSPAPAIPDDRAGRLAGLRERSGRRPAPRRWTTWTAAWTRAFAPAWGMSIPRSHVLGRTRRSDNPSSDDDKDDQPSLEGWLSLP